MSEVRISKAELVKTIITSIVLSPVYLYSWIENKIMYLFLKRDLSASLFNKLSSSLSAKALYKNKSSGKDKATILSQLNKNTAWGILSDLEKIDKKSFLEILKYWDYQLLNDCLFLEPVFRRNSILNELGISRNAGLKDNLDGGSNLSNEKRDKCHVEELYDLVVSLGQAADSLYQYGDSNNCRTLLDSLSKTDQNRFITLTMCLGDKRVHDVINNIYGGVKDIEVLLSQLEPQDRDEIEEISLQFKNRFSSIDLFNEIQQELQKAIQMLEGLTVEEAFWVLLHSGQLKAADWIEAIGKEDDPKSQIRLPGMVIYDPQKEEKFNLITAMRKAQGILHIHNHPESSNTRFGASSNDRGFAHHWKSYRPELSHKMKFFIVQRGQIIEYT